MKGGFVTRERTHLFLRCDCLIVVLVLWQTEPSWGGCLMTEALGEGISVPLIQENFGAEKRCYFKPLFLSDTCGSNRYYSSKICYRPINSLRFLDGAIT